MLLVFEEVVSTYYWAIPQNARQGAPSPEPGQERAKSKELLKYPKKRNQITPDSILMQIMPLNLTQPNVAESLPNTRGPELIISGTFMTPFIKQQVWKLAIVKDDVLLGRKRTHALISANNF